MKKQIDLPEHISERVESELMSGEELLWVGQPGRPVAPEQTPQTIQVALALSLSLFLGGGVLLGVRAAPSPILASLLVGLLVLMVAVIVAAPIIWNRMMMYKTIYAVTDQRVLILANDVQSYGKNDIQVIERKKVKPDGSGDLIFRRNAQNRRIVVGMMPATRTDTYEVGFFSIPHVREVEALMLRTFRMDAPSEFVTDDEPFLIDDEDVQYTNKS